MRRTPLLGSSLVALFAYACAAEETPPPAPPPPPASAPLPPPPQAPAPSPPPGVDVAGLDATLSPCDDFFQYACGGWNKANPIPEDQGNWGRVHVLIEQNELALKGILEQDAADAAALAAKKGPVPPKATGAATSGYAKALGDFYASCMDEAGVERDGTHALEPLLREIAAVSDAKSLAKAVVDLQLAGVDALFRVGSQQDEKDATQMIVGLDQGGLGMPDRDYYLKNDDPKLVKVREAYVAHVGRVLELLGDKPAAAQAEAEAVLALETEMAQAEISRVEHRDPQKTYHAMDRAGVAQAAPAFAWDVFWKALGTPVGAPINVAVPAFFSATFAAPAAGAGKGAAVAQLGRYRSYLRWHLARRFAKMLPQRFVDESFAFEKELTGAAKIQPRWKRCVHAVDSAMGEALAIPFVQQKLGAAGKQVTASIVSQIEAAMQTDLAGLAWMDADTRGRAADKVRKLSNKIGYPDTWRNYDSLAAKIRRTSYAANVAEGGRFETKRELAQVGKPVDRTEWHMSPPTVNAYYNPQLNEMVFPAGILQPPVYASAAPAPVNFGGLGSIMGHELTHGFDDAGRQFDGDGNLRDWWSPSVSADFDKRAACVADQFDGYVAIDDLHVNGRLTLGENLADLGGLKLALAVVHAAFPPSDEVDRQFFFGFSQIYCGSMRPEMQRARVRSDPHSPARWRVDGPLSNMPEFARAFSCRAGDAMVRPDEKRCAVW